MNKIHHALGLHFHQPLDNLLTLHNSPSESWEARQILRAYERPLQFLRGREDAARLHFSFSGTLLKQLEDPAVRETFADILDIEALVKGYRNAPVEIAGNGMYHPVYPLIPEFDWDAHTESWLGIGRHLFGREWFQGFWPPEMGFCMEMIPMLARHGFRYVLVDSYYIKPKRDMRWEEMRYRPYIARQDGSEIIVIPRDRELSDAQESGIDPGWFEHELVERTKWCDWPPLVTTWTDGDNGGWFRTADWEAGFWGHFLDPTLQKYRRGELAYQPVHIPEYLDRFPPTEEVEVHRGAWNTGDHWGGDFMQWTGSLLQKKGLDEIRLASRYYRRVTRLYESVADQLDDPDELKGDLLQAYDSLLRGETSCHFYWGSAWVPKAFDCIEETYRLLDSARDRLEAVRDRETRADSG